MLFHDVHQILKLRIAAVHSEVKLQVVQAETNLDDAMAYFNILSCHFP
jgi:hypothetical protein